MNLRFSKILVATLVLLLAPLLGLTHPGGHEPISAEAAKRVATDTAKSLTERDAGLGFGKLEPSWNDVPESGVAIHEQKSAYFIVSIRNEAVEKTLYVLISAQGEVYDANLTGIFEGLTEDVEDAPAPPLSGTPSM